VGAVLADLVTVYNRIGCAVEEIHQTLTICRRAFGWAGRVDGPCLAPATISVIALIGIILLIGIVKKNGIMMGRLRLGCERREGMPPEQAIYQDCCAFSPILMTTMAALL